MPSRTLARRRSNSSFCCGETPNRSKRSRKSSQIASMICILRSTGNALTSSVVIAEQYRCSGGTANDFSVYSNGHLADGGPSVTPELPDSVARPPFE